MTTNTAPHTPAVLRNRDGLAVIGRTLHDLRGIRFDGEEGGNTPPAAPAAPAPTEPPRPSSPFPGPATRGGQPAAPNGIPGPDAGQPPAAGQTATGAEAPAAGQPQYTPEQTQTYIKQLRDEAKANREAAEAAQRERDAATERQNKILKAAGLQVNADGTIVPFTETVPTDQAQAETAREREARENTERENLVLRVSPGLSANADAMLDSRTFAASLKALRADDRTGAEALVREWVANHPEHKIGPAPAAASAQTAHTGGAPVNGRQSREQALQARFGKKK